MMTKMMMVKREDNRRWRPPTDFQTERCISCDHNWHLFSWSTLQSIFIYSFICIYLLICLSSYLFIYLSTFLMHFSLITILVNIQSMTMEVFLSEKVGSRLSLFWFGIQILDLFVCLIWVHFEWWGEIPLSANRADCQHLKSVCFNKTKKCYIWKKYGKYQSVCLICVHFEWCTASKERSHSLPRDLMAYIWKE